MHKALTFSALISLLLIGAIFGFFYAWVCSTMWGLDQANPKVAIAAMQAMNASVRNAAFAPAFFATPFALLVTAILAFRLCRRDAAYAFGAAALIYLCGGLLLTMWVNVPMNEALAGIVVPTDEALAQTIWQDYSSVWQQWNLARTLASGAALSCVGFGLMRLGRAT